MNNVLLKFDHLPHRPEICIVTNPVMLFSTILWLSLVYAVGMIVNTLGAIGDLGDITVHA